MTTTPQPLPDTPVRSFWLRNALALALVLTTVLYALLAISTGRTLLHYITDADSPARIAQLRAATDAGTNVQGTVEEGYAPIWMQWMADLTDNAFSYGTDSLVDTYHYYASMPSTHQWVLGLHTLLGGTCMLLGGLQFWPGLRQRFPRLHRNSGMVFVGTAQLAMIMSMTYLTLTGVANTYAQLTFHVGLWFLALVVTASLWLSMYHVKQRQIAQHMGWLALAYGLLISAPLTRYDWVAIGMMFPQTSFNEANYSMMAILIVQCLLVGYALIGLSRLQSRPRPTLQPLPWADKIRSALPVWLPPASLILLAVALTTVWFYLLTPDLTQSPLAQRMIPAGVLSNESRVLVAQPGTRTLFTVLTVSLLLLAPFFLRRAFTLTPTVADLPADLRIMALALAAGAGITGLIQCSWGYALGAPSHATLAGGSFYMLTGSVQLLFALLLGWAVARHELALVKELGIFTLLAATAAPLFFWMLALLDVIGIPAQYLVTGHGYGLAIGLAPAGLLVGFVYAIYGSASRARAVY